MLALLRLPRHWGFSFATGWVLWTLAWAGHADHGTPLAQLYLSPHQTSYDLIQQAFIIHDPEQRWSVDGLLTGAQDWRTLMHAPRSAIRPRGGVYWLALIVDNQHPSADWVVRFVHGRTDRLDVITVPLDADNTATGAPQHQFSGMATDPGEPHPVTLGYAFPVRFAAEGRTLLLVRAQSMLFEGGLYGYLEEEAHFNSDYRHYELLVLGLLGAMLALTLYNAFIFMGTRDQSYLWYSLFAGLLTATWASYYGLWWRLAGVADPERWLAAGTQLGMLLFSLLFTQSFLNFHWRESWTGRFFVLAIAVVSLVLFTTPFVHAAYSFTAFWLIMLPAIVLLLWSSILRLWQGFKPARFLIVGQALVAGGVFVTGLGYLKIMPYDRPHPEQFTLLGAAEMLLLSLALADRINQLRAEKQIAEEANRLKSSFLAIMSHEIRTPLNGMLSMVKLLAKTPLNPRQGKFVASIDYSGRALLSLLNDLLDYSKIEAKRMELEQMAFDPRLLVESMVMLMSARASEKGLILTSQLDRELPPLVVGDPNRLRQVLLNLVGNAIKFTERGIVRVEAAVLGQDADKVRLQFAVVDSGIGIDAKEQQRVFELFHQGDVSVSRRFGGTGLGLAISKRLVEAMGGSLDLDSSPGVGSTFRVQLTLPWREAESRVPAQPERSLRILLVDDVEINRIAAAGLLEQEGHRCTMASSGAEALALLAVDQFDVVLLDIFMPQMDGHETARRIRALPDPAKARIPIVAVTANVDQPLVEDSGHIDAMVTKPLDMDALQRTLRAVTESAPASSDETSTRAYSPHHL